MKYRLKVQLLNGEELVVGWAPLGTGVVSRLSEYFPLSLNKISSSWFHSLKFVEFLLNISFALISNSVGGSNARSSQSLY